jgi:uncharacterized coiled-coil DUF342 family protein
MSEHDDWAEINRLEAENARLRAELAAEREKVERLASSADEANVLVNKLFAERDELREVLREARPFIFDLLGRSTAEMRERIDHLLLNKGGGDE